MLRVKEGESNMGEPNRINNFEKRRKNTKTISLLLILGGLLIIILLAIFLFGDNGGEEAEKGEPSTESTSESNSDSSDNNTTNEEASDTTSDDKTQSNDEDTALGDENNTSTDDSSNNDDSTKSDDQSTDSDQGASDDQSTDDHQSEDDEQNADDDQNTKENNMDNADVEKKPVEKTDDPNVEEAYTADWESVGTEQEGPHTKQFVLESQDWQEMKRAIRVATGIEAGQMITWQIANAGGQDVIGTVSPDNAPDKVYQVNLTWIDDKGWKPTIVKIIKNNPYD